MSTSSDFQWREEDYVVRLKAPSHDAEEEDFDQAFGNIISKTHLIAKVYSDKTFSANTFKGHLLRIWSLKGKFRVTDKKNNIYLVGFDYEEDCMKIFDGCPWLVGFTHVNFRRWLPHMSLNQVPTRLSYFWIQLHNLPLNFLAYPKIKQICDAFATPAVEIEPTIENCMGFYGFVRLKIEFLPECPLVPGLHVFDELGQKHWVKIKYERLGELCYRCGRITHTLRKCPRPPRQDEGVELESVLSVGPWMRAREVVGKYYPRKKQNNGKDAFVKDKNQDEENEKDEKTQPEEINTQKTGAMNQEAPDEQQEQGVVGDTTSKKRKVADAEVRGSAEIIAKRVHRGWINSMEELAQEIDSDSPVISTHKKPSWKRLARATQVAYHPTRSELERKKEIDSWVLGVTEQFEIVSETDMTGDGSLALPSEPE